MSTHNLKAEKLSRIEDTLMRQKDEQEALRKKQEREMSLVMAFGDEFLLTDWLYKNTIRYDSINPITKGKRSFVLGKDSCLYIDVKIGEHSHEKINLKKYEEKMFSADEIFQLLQHIKNFMKFNGVEIDEKIEDYKIGANWDKDGYQSKAGDILKCVLFGTSNPEQGWYYLKDGRMLVCDYDRFYVCDYTGGHPKALLLHS